jgi:hypothetical protein
MLLIHRYNTPILTGHSLHFTALQLHFTSPNINTLHGTPRFKPLHCTTCPVNLIRLDFTTHTILGEEYRSFSSSTLLKTNSCTYFKTLFHIHIKRLKPVKMFCKKRHYKKPYMFRSLFHVNLQGLSFVLSAFTTFQLPASSFAFFG